MQDTRSELQASESGWKSLARWLRRKAGEAGAWILNMIVPKAVSIMAEQVDQVEQRAAVIREWDKLYCDAIRAYRRGQGNVQLQTFADDGSIQPDMLVLVVTGKAPAAEMFYVISALLDAWDNDDKK